MVKKKTLKDTIQMSPSISTVSERSNTNKTKQSRESQYNPNIESDECIRAKTAESLKTKITSINKNEDQDSFMQDLELGHGFGPPT